jgi:hypothetical protein
MINLVIGYLILFLISLLLWIYSGWYIVLVFMLIFGYVFIDELIVYISSKRATYKNKQLIKESWKQH